MSEFFTTSQKSPLTNAERAQNPALPCFMNNVSLHGWRIFQWQWHGNFRTYYKLKQVKKVQFLKTEQYGLSCLLHAWMYYCIFAANFQPFCGLFAYSCLPHWRDASGVPNVQLSRLSGVGLPLPLPRPCCRWKPALLWVFNLPPDQSLNNPGHGTVRARCYVTCADIGVDACCVNKT